MDISPYYGILFALAMAIFTAATLMETKRRSV